VGAAVASEVAKIDAVLAGLQAEREAGSGARDTAELREELQGLTLRLGGKAGREELLPTLALDLAQTLTRTRTLAPIPAPTPIPTLTPSPTLIPTLALAVALTLPEPEPEPEPRREELLQLQRGLASLKPGGQSEERLQVPHRHSE